MNEEDFACDSFVPQKWRQDMCRKCYQSKKLHEKKLSSPSSSPSTPKKPQSQPSPPSLTRPPASVPAAKAEKPTQPTTQRTSPQLRASYAVQGSHQSRPPPPASAALQRKKTGASPPQIPARTPPSSGPAVVSTVVRKETTSKRSEKSPSLTPPPVPRSPKQNIPAKPSPPPAIPSRPPLSPVTKESQSAVPRSPVDVSVRPVAAPQEDSFADLLPQAVKVDKPAAVLVASLDEGRKELSTSETGRTGEEPPDQRLIETPAQDEPAPASPEVTQVPTPYEAILSTEEQPVGSHPIEEKYTQETIEVSEATLTDSLAALEEGKGGHSMESTSSQILDELSTGHAAEDKEGTSGEGIAKQTADDSQAGIDLDQEILIPPEKEKVASFLEPVAQKQESELDLHVQKPGSPDPPLTEALPCVPAEPSSTQFSGARYSPSLSPVASPSPPIIIGVSSSPPSIEGESSPPPVAGVPPPPPSPIMGTPPPPPPLPPLIGIPSTQPVRVRVIKPPVDGENSSPSSSGSLNASDVEEPQLLKDPISEHQQLLSSIKTGVQLRPTPLPKPRDPSVVEVIDVRTELQERMMKRQKAEFDKAASKLDNHRKTVDEIREQLFRMRGTPTYLHHLVSMMERIRDFLSTCEISVEILEKKCRWPSILVADLESVLKFMDDLTAKVAEVEKLCNQTMQLKTQQLNVDTVQRCVAAVLNQAFQIRTVHDRHTRYSEASSSFPVDPIDIHRMMRRAAEAITPILDRLYDKALQTHELISDPTLSKFDMNFRLQNAQRQLRMCCSMSDSLFSNLSVPRHQNYSKAMLKVSELELQYQHKLAVLERRGNWDEEETVVLQPSQPSKQASQQVKEETVLVQQILTALSDGSDIPEDAFSMSENLYLRSQLSLVRAAVAQDNTQVVDAFVALSAQVFTSEDVKEKLAFDWLLEAVVKGSHRCIQHMVSVINLPINCQSLDAGNSLLHIAARRQDLSTMCCLVRLGINPLLVNNNSRTALSMLALKCFPPQTFPDIEIKEFPFDLSVYINNESLSDCVLVSSEGEKFHAHKLVLCAQSGMFKSMLESEHWAGSRQGNEVSLPTVNSQVLKLLLQYLYTGQSVFPHDDLNVWIDLLATADQFLLERLRLHCERVLSGKIDPEVVVPMYRAAFQFSASRLMANCSCFLLEHYQEVEDPGHEALLHLLENAKIGAKH